MPLDLTDSAEYFEPMWVDEGEYVVLPDGAPPTLHAEMPAGATLTADEQAVVDFIEKFKSEHTD